MTVTCFSELTQPSLCWGMLSVSWCGVFHLPSAPVPLTKPCCLCCGPQDTRNPHFVLDFSFLVGFISPSLQPSISFQFSLAHALCPSQYMKRTALKVLSPGGCPFPTHIVVFAVSHLLFGSEPAKCLPAATAIPLFLTTPNLC